MDMSDAPILSPEAAEEQKAPQPAAPARRPRRARRRLNLLFLVAVAIPTAFAVWYYGLFASDVYLSEARFLVRNPHRQQMSGLGAFLQGTAFSRAQDDTYSVHDFIRSRDALREVDERLGFRRAYGQPSIDAVNRFPGLYPDESFEALHRYYQKQVSIQYDSVSSISILEVRAFDPEDAQRINELLLEMGERLVNNMNERSRRDLIDVAEREVTIAETRAKDAAAALAAFRSDRSVFDPGVQGAMQLQSVAKLKEELLAAESQLAQIRSVSPANPQIGSLRDRVNGLRQAIREENARVLGRAGGLVAESPEYDRLMLEKAFADRQLATALAALDSARAEAQRKQLYLERLVQPHRPDYAVEPRRIRSVFTVFVLGMVAWGVLGLIVAGVREHTET